MTNPQNSRRQEVLDALPGSHLDVIAKTGMHRNVAGRWLAKLHEAGEIHVIGWNRTPGGGPFVPIYESGPGEDVPCTLEPIPVAVNRTNCIQRKRERHQKARWTCIVAQHGTGLLARPAQRRKI